MKTTFIVLATALAIVMTAALYFTGPATKAATKHYETRAYCLTALNVSREDCPDVRGRSMWQPAGDTVYPTEVRTSAWERILGAISGTGNN
jgi:hypothetical protein